MHSDRSSLDDLQRFQAMFDAACGLDFPFDPGDASQRLHRVEFACLALAGEVGELANIVKKARRAAWTGRDPSLDAGRLHDELADVVAYTLKLANLLDVDLEGAYRSKMDRNWLRFGPPPRVVTLMGPPGAGKSTIARLFDGDAQVHLERSEDNDDLALLAWKDNAQALSSQMWFLTSTERFLAGALAERPLVLDQDPRAVVGVYARHFAEAGWLDAAAVRRLDDELRIVEDRLRAWRGGRVTVLLDAAPEILEDRVDRRDGRSPGIDWIRDIRERFRAFASELGDVAVIRTDECEPREALSLVREHVDAH